MGNLQGNAGEINRISFLLFALLVCLFPFYRGISNKFEAKFVLFDETANKGKMNKIRRKKILKNFSARCRRNEEDIIMIRLIEIRNRTLPFLRNKPLICIKQFHLLILFEDNWYSLIWPPVLVVRKLAENLKVTSFRAWRCVREVMRFWTYRYAGELDSP